MLFSWTYVTASASGLHSAVLLLSTGRLKITRADRKLVIAVLLSIFYLPFEENVMLLKSLNYRSRFSDGSVPVLQLFRSKRSHKQKVLLIIIWLIMICIWSLRENYRQRSKSKFIDENSNQSKPVSTSVASARELVSPHLGVFSAPKAPWCPKC